MGKYIYELKTVSHIQETIMPQEVMERYEQDHGKLPAFQNLMIFSKISKK